ncbi:MAG TPA: hypothetical protein VGI32_04290 [Steroidobacteraceae bacterium]|jgi:hypothetical protein
MDESTQAPRASIAPALTVGALQGLLLWWLAHSKEGAAWPGSSHVWYANLFSFGIIVGPLIYALAPWSKRRTTWISITLIAAWLLWSGWQFGTHEWAPGAFYWSDQIAYPLFLLQALILFHAVPFLQGYLREGSLGFSYRILFLETWQNALRLALAALFTGIFWLLLWLCAQLFEMIGLPFIRVVLFQVPGFAWLVTALAFGVGFHLVGSAERLLTALRQQVLTLLKWLVPVATLIVVAFSIALLFRTPVLLAEHRHVIRAVWLLWLVIVSVYLYNAAYQDGSVAEPYPAALARAIRWATPLLVLLVGMALYDLWIRVNAYGLTSSRYWGAIVGAVTLAYAIGYALAGFRPGSWMGAMGRANVRVAVGIIVVLIFALTPVLSPAHLSARSQGSRLANSAGTAGPEDFMALRFDAGTYGQEELMRLVAAADTPASIRTGARAALAVKAARERGTFRYTTIAQIELTFEAFPADAAIDDELRQKILAEQPRARNLAGAAVDMVGGPDFAFSGEAAARPHREKKLCSPDLPCPVLFADLDGDGQNEAIAFLQYQAVVFQRGRAGWKELGRVNWRFRAGRKQQTGEDLLKELRDGDYRVAEPRWKSLQIGHFRLPFDLPVAPERGAPPS